MSSNCWHCCHSTVRERGWDWGTVCHELSHPAPANSFHTTPMSLNCLFSQHFKVPFPFPLLFLHEHCAAHLQPELLQTKQLPVLYIQEGHRNTNVRIWGKATETHPMSTLVMARNQKETSASSILLFLSKKKKIKLAAFTQKRQKWGKKKFKVLPIKL